MFSDALGWYESCFCPDPPGIVFAVETVEWYAPIVSVGAATSRPQPDGFNAPR